MWDYASATPPLHPTKHINKLNNYVKELYPALPNGTNIGEGAGVEVLCKEGIGDEVINEE